MHGVRYAPPPTFPARGNRGRGDRDDGSKQQGDTRRQGCSSWCIADHGTQESPEDQRHESSVIAVPVVEYWGRFTNGLWRLESDGIELTMLLEQHTSSTIPESA